LVEVPAEVQIRAAIKQGSVYYFPEESFSSAESHYFIVLNYDPLAETVIILACASSRTDKVKQRRCGCPSQTLVEISPKQYPEFATNSIIDCNRILEKSVGQLVEKLASGKLKLKTEMDLQLVEQLRSGVLLSPQIDRRIKTMLNKKEKA
jgi:hypothetical protein